MFLNGRLDYAQVGQEVCNPGEEYYTFSLAGLTVTLAIALDIHMTPADVVWRHSLELLQKSLSARQW